MLVDRQSACERPGKVRAIMVNGVQRQPQRVNVAMVAR
jgi:hypothetical protein